MPQLHVHIGGPKFCMQTPDTLQEEWLKFEQLLGKTNLIHSFQLENWLISLDLTELCRVQFSDCGITKPNDKELLAIHFEF
jgi:hypothetical protein